MENFFYFDHPSIAFDDSVYIERFTRISTSYRTRVFQADNPHNSPNISIICRMHGRENSSAEETTQSFFHRRYSRFCYYNCVFLRYCLSVHVVSTILYYSFTTFLHCIMQVERAIEGKYRGSARFGRSGRFRRCFTTLSNDGRLFYRRK